MTSWQSLLMLQMMFQTCCCGVLAHFSWRAFASSWGPRGWYVLTSTEQPSIFQKCSIGFKSGDWVGQSRCWMLRLPGTGPRTWYDEALHYYPEEYWQDRWHQRMIWQQGRDFHRGTEPQLLDHSGRHVDSFYSVCWPPPPKVILSHLHNSHFRPTLWL